jgi:hypothetical protein
MNEPKGTDPKRLKRMALVPIAVGLIAMIVGAVLMKSEYERRDEQRREFMAGRRRFEDLQGGLLMAWSSRLVVCSPSASG